MDVFEPDAEHPSDFERAPPKPRRRIWRGLAVVVLLVLTGSALAVAWRQWAWGPPSTEPPRPSQEEIMAQQMTGVVRDLEALRQQIEQLTAAQHGLMQSVGALQLAQKKLSEQQSQPAPGSWITDTSGLGPAAALVRPPAAAPQRPAAPRNAPRTRPAPQ